MSELKDTMPFKCAYPTVRFVAFEQRAPGGQVFVPDPSMRGRYILTDRSVALVACSHCKSIPGEPCKGSQGYGSGTHSVRREKVRWSERRKELKLVRDIIKPHITLKVAP
jgi:hypothetical protein